MTNEEIKKEVLHRVAVQKKKRQRILQVSASLGAVVLVSLAGVGLMGGGVFKQTPPVSDTIAKTTATASTASTERESTTTTGATKTTTVTTVTTTTPTQAITTRSQTQASIKGPHNRPTTRPTQATTEPPKSSSTKQSVTGYIPPIPTTTQPTTSTGSDRLLITGDEPDNSFSDQGSYSNKERYISNALKEKMNEYKGVDVMYAVLVAIPAMREDMEEDFWASTEELEQFYKEYYDVLDAFNEEALLYNPTWDCRDVNDIEVWTDTMRENWDYWVTFVEKRRELEGQPRTDYVKSVLTRRLEVLIDICEKEPIVIVSETISVFRYAYYGELTAEQINTLAAQGGYVFRLASEPEDIIVDM